ncbi:nuclease [Maribellus luteus]|uniref:Nuclease n=1 Tax=Maribellus luteus TaxID=2305463 RepID=A0A399SZN0_9BACT|nr:thermonuclease family protein [Maribellus luteus]RIJ47835.1 nuclease [Maribellus luteus]
MKNIYERKFTIYRYIPYLDLNYVLKTNHTKNITMYTYRAKVDRVVDGDTLDLVIDLGFKITTLQRIRLRGINTPETYNVKKDSEEYKRGMEAKEYVLKRMEENKYEVMVETNKDVGKFGRYIGVIRLADSLISLNDDLVEKGLAVVAEY